MRRPVKPFVTEYRGTVRKTKDGLHDGSDAKLDGAASRSRSFAEANKLFRSEPAEDGYEAALRAADALFSSPARQEPGIAAASSAPGAAGVPPVGHGLRSDTTAPPQARRILQAIEPAPVDPLAAIEAERGQKRRGRKPGSKNKPKAPVAEPAATVLSELQAGLAPPTVGPAEADLPFDEPASASVENDAAGNHQQRSRNTRFGWRRAGLRPGERWKRRLPKAAR